MFGVASFDLNSFNFWSFALSVLRLCPSLDAISQDLVLLVLVSLLFEQV